jgi:hypothetical protein
MTRSQAAAWIADQVGSDQTIGCAPLMCAALRARGIATSRLLPLPASAGSPRADVVVTSPAPHNQPAGQASDDDAPVPIASFGSGVSLIQVRAAYPGGVAAYHAALRADLAARKAGGVQLLQSRRIQVSPQCAGQLRAGEVDTRLLVALAALASLQPLRVVAFGEASPRERVPLAEAPLREVTITSADGRGLAAVLAMVRAQRAPFQPMHVTAVGQAGLLIEFAAPSPIGLLTGGASG